MPKQNRTTAPAKQANSTEQELHVRLTYTIPPSNKEYRADLVKSSDGWVVNFQYGRIGSTLNAGSKTQAPMAYAQARKVFDKLVEGKVKEGYIADATAPSASAYQAPVSTKQDTGARPQLLTVATWDDAYAMLDDAGWCLQAKHDGKRIFVFADASGIYGANRKGEKVSLPNSIVAWANAKRERGDAKSFTLDGELVGEIYFIFDLTMLNGTATTERTYSERLSLLARYFRTTSSEVVMSETAVGKNKLDLLKRLQRANAEGAVFKRLDAKYEAGRLPTQYKLKFWETASFVVKSQNQGVRSIELGLLDADGQTVNGWGSCTIPTNYPVPNVGAVVEVKYLYAVDSIYQPQYKGERDDIDRAACVVGQIKFKPGERVAA
jgi:bifunctional non-homologous end joining protein LigD